MTDDLKARFAAVVEELRRQVAAEPADARRAIRAAALYMIRVPTETAGKRAAWMVLGAAPPEYRDVVEAAERAWRALPTPHTQSLAACLALGHGKVAEELFEAAYGDLFADLEDTQC